MICRRISRCSNRKSRSATHQNRMLSGENRETRLDRKYTLNFSNCKEKGRRCFLHIGWLLFISISFYISKVSELWNWYFQWIFSSRLLLLDQFELRSSSFWLRLWQWALKILVLPLEYSLSKLNYQCVYVCVYCFFLIDT